MSTVFDIGGPLPRGRLQIEASAGTGKTYTIAALVVRAIAGDRSDAIGIDQVLVVTFTRAAAAELRDRIRRKLAAALDCVVHGVVPPEDPWMAVLAGTADLEGRALAAERLRRALARFDEATITTIHGFCQQVLVQFGDADLGAVRETGVGELVSEVVRDLVIAELADDPLALSPRENGWPLDRPRSAEVRPLEPGKVERHLATAVRTVLGSPGSTAVPDADHPGVAGRWAQLVQRAVAEVRRRERAARQLSFDRMIGDVCELVRADPDAAAWLADRYAMVLVDEFQDTDRQQWEIFSTAFGGSSLVTVGDPKQAIYRFRGADVDAYLAASDSAEAARLDTNYRSDADVLDALALLWSGAQLGTPKIRFAPVAAAPGAGRGADDPELAAKRGGAAVVVNLVEHGDLEPQDPRGTCYSGPLQSFVVEQLALRVHELLGHGWSASDIAVLVNSQRQAAEVAATLTAHGVASTRARTGDVFASEAADQWRILLTALAAPGRAPVARAAGLGWFIGARPVDLVDPPDLAGDPDLGEPDRIARDGAWSLATVQHRLAELAHRCRQHGLVAVVEELRRGGAFVQLAGGRDGDRRLADIEHIAEVLVSDVGSQSVEPSELLRALDARIVGAAIAGEETTMRRLSDDAPAVQISTIHAAKGLEYPVVLVPFASSERPNTTRPYVFNGPDGRRIDVASWINWTDDGSYRDKKRGTDARRHLATAEVDGDALRLLYVAMTRAKHHLQLWWAPTWRWSSAPFTRLIVDREGAGALNAYEPNPPTLQQCTVADVGRQLDALAAASGGTIEVRRVAARLTSSATASIEAQESTPVTTAAPPPAAAGSLRLAAWRRDAPLLDPARATWSFTRITRVADELADASETHRRDGDDESIGAGLVGGGRDEPHLADEGVAPVGAQPVDHAGDHTAGDLDPHASDAGADEGDGFIVTAALPLLAGGIAGAAFGVMAHAVLEHVDLTAVDAADALVREVGEQARRAGVAVDVETVAAGLAAAAATPLGALFDDRPLDSFAPRDRLAELTFDLDLSGDTAVTVGRIADVLAAELPADDPVRPCIEPTRRWLGAVGLAGWLTGSIDGVFRVGAGTANERYVVVDYKTNRLHAPDATSRADVLAAYHPHRLVAAMAHHHYPLQALLYTVALHRYLGWRLGDAYDPARHLGGVGYLFVRGMVGPDTPVDSAGVTGVFAWRPPAAAVVAVDSLLRGSGR